MLLCATVASFRVFRMRSEGVGWDYAEVRREPRPTPSISVGCARRAASSSCRAKVRSDARYGPQNKEAGCVSIWRFLFFVGHSFSGYKGNMLTRDGGTLYTVPRPLM